MKSRDSLQSSPIQPAKVIPNADRCGVSAFERVGGIVRRIDPFRYFFFAASIFAACAS